MYTLIETLDDLAYLNQELLQKPFLGVDTEFRRTTKDNMKLALLQVNDEEEVYLIDAIQIKDPLSHASFLFSEDVIKIFHSCKEDLEAIFSWTNKEMKNIFDTQIANSFLGGDFTISYQGLVENELGILLEKKETRSNWLRRPLTDSQLKYAALDVEYLIHLYKGQKKDLSKNLKNEWLNQEIEQLLRVAFDQESAIGRMERVLSKYKETETLIEFNKVVVEIANRENINETLFFSKKSQKDFLRMSLLKGLDFACSKLTLWRRDLIKERMKDILE